jgi:hypothetical protein
MVSLRGSVSFATIKANSTCLLRLQYCDKPVRDLMQDTCNSQSQALVGQSGHEADHNYCQGQGYVYLYIHSPIHHHGMMFS